MRALTGGVADTEAVGAGFVGDEVHGKARGEGFRGKHVGRSGSWSG